jgi:DNA invertase Pin-like site-specific DNA recombinase
MEHDMLVGVARTSTLEQVAGLEAQVRDLKAYGCEEVYQEQVSSIGEREQLDAAIKSLRSGDKLVVCKLDRLARSVRHLGDLIDTLEARGAGLVILSMGGQQVDTTTATGKMMLNVMASVAQFEREMMLERQKEGIAKAKAEGKYTGRKPTAMAKSDAVLSLLNSGMSKAKVCEQIGISRASLYRIISRADTGHIKRTHL